MPEKTGVLHAAVFLPQCVALNAGFPVKRPHFRGDVLRAVILHGKVLLRKNKHPQRQKNLVLNHGFTELLLLF